MVVMVDRYGGGHVTAGGCWLVAGEEPEGERDASHESPLPASQHQAARKERPKTYLEPLKQLCQGKPPSHVIGTSQAAAGAVVEGFSRCVPV